MRRLLVALIVAMVFLAGSAHAADRKFYFAASAGLNLLMEIDENNISNTFDPGYNFMVAVGIDIRAFRLEGEIGYRTADLDKVTVFGSTFSADGDISVLSFMFNAYYDVEISNSSFSPYLGVGTGIIDSDLSGSAPGVRLTGGNTNSAYQVMFGVGYEVDPTLVLTAGYRFLGTFAFEENVLAHDFNLGVRFIF